MRISALLFAMIGLFLIARFADAEDIVRLRVLSYNIHHGEGVDGKVDLERIANVIRVANADIVALQEVDQRVPRSGDVDQPATLSKLLGMQAVFGANIDLQGGKYGNAVLTKFPVLHYENVLLPSVDQGEQRGVMVVAVQLSAMDFPLYVLATHLDFRRDDTERMASIEQIEEIAAKRETHPIMLVGDLNATRTSSTLRQLQKSWKIAGDQEQPTSPVDNPIRQIDFILVRPPQKWQVIETKVLDEKVASDHRAILAIVELKID